MKKEKVRANSNRAVGADKKPLLRHHATRAKRSRGLARLLRSEMYGRDNQ
jgi:hypothetical protein